MFMAEHAPMVNSESYFRVSCNLDVGLQSVRYQLLIPSASDMAIRLLCHLRVFSKPLLLP